MNAVSTRYPYSRALVEPRGYPTCRALEHPSRYIDAVDRLERPVILPRGRSYPTCLCTTSVQGDHLCRTCILATHAAKQILNIRGGDYCDCRQCALSGEDTTREELELEALERDRYGYYSTGSDSCRSCGRVNCPLDHRNSAARIPLVPRRATYPSARELAYPRRDLRPLLGQRAYTPYNQ